jgi:hypothetical protein
MMKHEQPTTLREPAHDLDMICGAADRGRMMGQVGLYILWAWRWKHLTMVYLTPLRIGSWDLGLQNGESRMLWGPLPKQYRHSSI